jgi:chemotaxis protein MotB
MADKSKAIIIKKVKKGHEGHHGGSWKVAYADFVTAMMAFFLLMWLLAMVSPEKRAALSEYFKHFSLFEKAGQSFMMEGQQQVLEKGQEMKTFDFGDGKAALSPEDLKEKLKKAIEEKLRALKDQAVVDIFEGGVRIQLVDLEGKSMFQPGSAQLTPSAKEILKLVGDNIKDLPNRIAVEGHTDASPLKTGRTTNWELSTDRASSARRELETNGIDPVRIARVVGYADTELLIKENPNDPRNRRISIILLQSKVEQLPKVQEPAQPPAPTAKPVQPPPPPPPQPEEVKKPAVEKPAPKQEQKRVFEPGIRPKEPIEIKKPIDVPGAKPETQLKTAPQPAAEQAKKPSVAKPEPQKQVPQPKPAPPPPPKPKPEEVKKPQVEKSAPKQEQKKDSTKPDIGIKPIKPIDPIGK